MHPREFERKLFASGRTTELIELLKFSVSQIQAKKTFEHREAYSFVDHFMLCLTSQLHRLGPSSNLDDDPILKVWHDDMVVWGISRDQVAEYLRSHDL